MIFSVSCRATWSKVRPGDPQGMGLPRPLWTGDRAECLRPLWLSLHPVPSCPTARGSPSASRWPLRCPGQTRCARAGWTRRLHGWTGPRASTRGSCRPGLRSLWRECQGLDSAAPHHGCGYCSQGRTCLRGEGKAGWPNRREEKEERPSWETAAGRAGGCWQEHSTARATACPGGDKHMQSCPLPSPSLAHSAHAASAPQAASHICSPYTWLRPLPHPSTAWPRPPQATCTLQSQGTVSSSVSGVHCSYTPSVLRGVGQAAVHMALLSKEATQALSERGASSPGQTLPPPP